MIGQIISHYKILAKLGEGGMGVVYKAEDTKLKRIVALKFLSAIALGGEEKSRFLREAQAAAALNHPNICTIHAIDEVDGQMFIAMEFIEGQSLREKIEAGPLKIDEAIKFTTQVADGLQAAHEKGITHRDIKSANVMITQKGQAKIMDFGLAKLARGGTMLTKEGMTLGTAAYMSPEQARGEVVDHRTDIWSLGVVLYEMISGRLPFRGEYEQAMLYAILNEDPEPLTALRTGVPMELERIVNKLLAKDPALRYQHADELPADLRVIKTHPIGLSRISTIKTAPAPPAPRQRLLIWIMAGITLTAVVVALWGWLRPIPLSTKTVMRFNLDLPAPQQFRHEVHSTSVPLATISPDGQLLAYAARGERTTLIYIRPLDRFEPMPLSGTEGAYTPFFSPDGKWIGFFTGSLLDSKLKKVSVAGGTVQTLCDASAGCGAAWGPDNTIVFASSSNAGLFRVSADGGTPQPFTELDRARKEASHVWPQFLPDGQAVIFTIEQSDKSFDEATIVVQSLKTGERIVLIEGGMFGRYVPTGHLLFARSDALLTVSFDLERLQVTGTPVQVLSAVAFFQGLGASHFAFANNGTLIYLPGGDVMPRNELVLVDRTGKPQKITDTQAAYASPSLSPDGGYVAVTIVSANNDLWLVDMERGTQTRLTFEAENGWPIWMADGKRIVFSSDQADELNLYAIHADGSGAIERLTTSAARQIVTACSPDGQLLAFYQHSSVTGYDIWLLPLAGEGKPRPFRNTRFDERFATFSLDSRLLAYQSDESGQAEVYVQSVDGKGKKWQISVSGGSAPRWSPNGRELFYFNGDQFMVVEFATVPSFRAGRPSLLFEVPFTGKYDITPDGERFVMIKPGVPKRLTRMNVVPNWFEELKRLVPAKN